MSKTTNYNSFAIQFDGTLDQADIVVTTSKNVITISTTPRGIEQQLNIIILNPKYIFVIENFYCSKLQVQFKLTKKNCNRPTVYYNNRSDRVKLVGLNVMLGGEYGGYHRLSVIENCIIGNSKMETAKLNRVQLINCKFSNTRALFPMKRQLTKGRMSARSSKYPTQNTLTKIPNYDYHVNYNINCNYLDDYKIFFYTKNFRIDDKYKINIYNIDYNIDY